MSLELIRPPAVEPVSIAEVKAHARIDTSEEDAIVASLITTSRLSIEAALGLGLVSQDWRIRLDAVPRSGVIALPLRPLAAVLAVRVRDAAGGSVTLGGADYEVDAASVPPRIALSRAASVQPGVRLSGIEVDVTVGYGDAAADVPAPIRQALLMLFAHWYEHREPVAVAGAPARIPDTVDALLAPYREVRL